MYPGETEWRDKTARLMAGRAGRVSGGAEEEWFSKTVIYSLYVDLFNGTIEGLTERLPYLEDLGVNCLHLLPVLDSPMKDAGFDIRNYTHIRPEIAASGNPDAEFDGLLSEAHRRGIRIIFDIALNHCSAEHPWFVEAQTQRTSRYRGFFIWSDTAERYKEARIIFKGLCKSNWEYDRASGQYYFHRFFPIQPDLNYRNPEVLHEMIAVLLSWLKRGIDGFRADAIPYLWKEEGTSCENLPQTHSLLKIFRFALDAVKPGTLFLAEANQPPCEIVEYLRTEDECNAAYHFPLMPRIFKALAVDEGTPIRSVLSSDVTPAIPASASWLNFLRCHDELTLEMVAPDEREVLFNHYVRDPEWNFREGEGISGRLFTLLKGDTDRILLAFAIVFTLPGTPVIYYGDEVAVPNDVDFWRQQTFLTGYNDSRYLNRGPLDWDAIESDLSDPATPGSIIRLGLTKLIALKKAEPVLADGILVFHETGDPALLAYDRRTSSEKIMVRCNLGLSGRFLQGDASVATGAKILFVTGAGGRNDREYLKSGGVMIARERGPSV